MEKAWIGRAQNPIPIVEIKQLVDDEIDDDEIDDMVATWSAARTSPPTGSVGFSDHRVELRTHGEVQTSLFEEGRNAVVLDVARLTGLPAALLDGSLSTATLSYSTQEGRTNEFMTFSLSQWTDPIQARLSLDDVAGPGRVIRFDKAELVVRTQAPIDQPTKD